MIFSEKQNNFSPYNKKEETEQQKLNPLVAALQEQNDWDEAITELIKNRKINTKKEYLEEISKIPTEVAALRYAIKDIEKMIENIKSDNSSATQEQLAHLIGPYTTLKENLEEALKNKSSVKNSIFKLAKDLAQE